MFFFKKLLSITMLCAILFFTGNDFMRAQDSNVQQPNRVYLPLVSEVSRTRVDQTMARRELCHGLIGSELYRCLSMAGLWNKILEMDASDLVNAQSIAALQLVALNGSIDNLETRPLKLTGLETLTLNFADLNSATPIAEINGVFYSGGGFASLPPNYSKEDGWSMTVPVYELPQENGYLILEVLREQSPEQEDDSGGETVNSLTGLIVYPVSNGPRVSQRSSPCDRIWAEIAGRLHTVVNVHTKLTTDPKVDTDGDGYAETDMELLEPILIDTDNDGIGDLVLQIDAIEWFLDGMPVGGGKNLTLLPGSLSQGQHTITMKIRLRNGCIIEHQQVISVGSAIPPADYCGTPWRIWDYGTQNIKLAPEQDFDGTDDNDLLLGDERDNKIRGRKGDDCIYGFAGNDQLGGDKGLIRDRGDYWLGYVDTIEGGEGFDEIKAGPGSDKVSGGPDNDTIWGDDGDDTLNGDAGNDFIKGDSGGDKLYGSEGDDQLVGDAGSDEILGGSGNDKLQGDAGRDLLDGESDFDEGNGDSGKDTCRNLERDEDCEKK